MIEFWKYAKIKDYYCVCYFGPSDEYLVQLKLLKPIIEQHLPGLKIHFGCRDDKAHLFDGCGEIMKLSDIKAKKLEFAHIRELRFNGSTHPVEDFLLESGIAHFPVAREISEQTARGVIVSSGNYPTKPLLQHQIEAAKKRMRSEGFQPELSDNVADAGFVVGVESVAVVKALSMGIRTMLVPTGVGTKLLKGMFPNLEILGA